MKHSVAMILCLNFYFAFTLQAQCINDPNDPNAPPIPIHSFGGGSGEPNDPYLIFTAHHLHEIIQSECTWDKHIALMSDIDVNISGISFVSFQEFNGVFEGNDFFVFNSKRQPFAPPLFESINHLAQVNNLTLINFNGSLTSENYGQINHCTVVNGNDGTGIIAGTNYGTIHDCMTAGETAGAGLVGINHGGLITDSVSLCRVSEQGSHAAGGLVEVNTYGGIIRDCYATGYVTGSSRVGGLVGHNTKNSIIEKSFSTGRVYSEGNSVGGLVGQNDFEAHIKDCYATGIVTGNGGVGGLVGKNTNRTTFYPYEIGTIERCYSTGQVTGTIYTGGLVGRGDPMTTKWSFWDIQSSGQTISDGGMGRTSSEMHSANTYMTWGCTPEACWIINENYNTPPLFTYQQIPGELITTGPFGNDCSTTGDPNNPFCIYTAKQFNAIGTDPDYWDKHFKLMNDIDMNHLNGQPVNHIGEDPTARENISPEFPLQFFTGSFDGNNHVIDNLTMTGVFDNIDTSIGLFRLMGTTAVVKNLGLTNTHLNIQTNSAYISAAPLVGYNGYGDPYDPPYLFLTGGKILNCFVKDSTLESENNRTYISGLIARNHIEGIVKNCFTDITLITAAGAGITESNAGTISNCYTKGMITDIGSFTSEGEGISGIALFNFSYEELYQKGMIENSYSIANIICDPVSTAAGISIYQYQTNLRHCYFAGTFLGTGNNFGLVAYDEENSTFTKCFWDTTKNPGIVGVGNIPDPADAIGEITTNLQLRQTFTDAGWDFVGESTNGPDDHWRICENNSYPTLSWQPFNSGDFNCSDSVNMIDFGILTSWWLNNSCDGSNNNCQLTDIDLSGEVNLLDLQTFISNWLI